METDNITVVSPADVQRAKDNDAVAQKIQANADKRVELAKTNVDQEPILVNDATKGILERQGITNTITQDEIDAREKDTKKSVVINTITQAISKPATGDEQVKTVDVNDQSTEHIDLTEEDLGALERAGITEEQILDSDGTLAQIKELAQNQLKKEQEAKGETTVVKPDESQDLSSMVISDEYAEQLALTYPFAKSLKGKSMEDVMGILSKQNQHISKLENSKTVVDDESNIDKTNSQKSNNDLDISQDEVIDLLNLSPEKATEAIKALMVKTAQSVTAESVAKEVKKLFPNLQAMQQQSNEGVQKSFYDALAEQLPKGADPKQIVADWKKVNVNMSQQSKTSLSDNVELLITTISDSFKLGKLSKENTDLVNTQNSEVKKQTYLKLKELIGKSKKLGVHNGQFNFKRKEMIDITGEPKDASEELMDKIIKRNLNQ